MASIMSVGLATESKYRGRRSMGRARLAALCKAWTAYTLKRAIADVTATSEQDYRAFGLDKAEMIAALTRLRDEIKGDGAGARGSAPSYSDVQLAIVIARRWG